MILQRPRGTEGSRYMCDENRAEGLQVEAGLLLYWIHVRVCGDEKFYRHKEVGTSLYTELKPFLEVWNRTVSPL